VTSWLYGRDSRYPLKRVIPGSVEMDGRVDTPYHAVPLDEIVALLAGARVKR